MSPNGQATVWQGYEPCQTGSKCADEIMNPANGQVGKVQTLPTRLSIFFPPPHFPQKWRFLSCSILPAKFDLIAG